jgi:hypothetical protein
MKWIIALALLVSAVLTACTDHSEASEFSSEEEEGIQMRIDNGPWVKLEGTAQKVEEHEFTLNARNDDNGFTAISWKGDKPTGKFPWSFVARGPIEGTLFQSRLEQNIDYFSFYIESKDAMDSPGNITILAFGEPGGYVTGYFVIEKASKVNDASGTKIGTMKIEGKFRVRRTS